MSREQSELADGLHLILKPRGFRKRKLVWRRPSGEDIVQVFGFDKSTFADQLQLHYGLQLLRFSENPRLPLHELHVQWFVSEKLPKDRLADLYRALNLEEPVPMPDRVAELEDVLCRYVLPAFESCATLDRLREVLNDLKHPHSTLFCRFRRELL